MTTSGIDLTIFDTFNTVCATFFAVSTVTTLARLYTRAGILRSLGLDDFLIAFAGLLGLVLFPLQFNFNLRLKRSLEFSPPSGGAQGGRPSGQQPPGPPGPPGTPGGPAAGLPPAGLQQFIQATKLDYISLVFYLVQLGIIKLSILAFYYRFLPNKYRWPTIIVATTVAVYTTVTCLASIFQCTPISDAFQPRQSNNCRVDRRKLHIAIGILNVCTDIIILLMPVPTLVRLKVGLRKRVVLLLIFSVGMVGTISTGMRLNIIVKMDRARKDMSPGPSRLAP